MGWTASLADLCPLTDLNPWPHGRPLAWKHQFYLPPDQGDITVLIPTQSCDSIYQSRSREEWRVSWPDQECPIILLKDTTQHQSSLQWQVNHPMATQRLSPGHSFTLHVTIDVWCFFLTLLRLTVQLHFASSHSPMFLIHKWWQLQL